MTRRCGCGEPKTVMQCAVDQDGEVLRLGRIGLRRARNAIDENVAGTPLARERFQHAAPGLFYRGMDGIHRAPREEPVRKSE